MFVGPIPRRIPTNKLNLANLNGKKNQKLFTEIYVLTSPCKLCATLYNSAVDYPLHRSLSVEMCGLIFLMSNLFFVPIDAILLGVLSDGVVLGEDQDGDAVARLTPEDRELWVAAVERASLVRGRPGREGAGRGHGGDLARTPQTGRTRPPASSLRPGSL